MSNMDKLFEDFNTTLKEYTRAIGENNKSAKEEAVKRMLDISSQVTKLRKQEAKGNGQG